MRWEHKINLVEIWKKFNTDTIDDNEEEFVAARDAIVAALKKDKNYSNLAFKSFVDNLALSEHTDEFNWIWTDIYNYCDFNKIWLGTTI